MIQTYTFYITGLRCRACVVLTEDLLTNLSEVTGVRVDLALGKVELVGEFSDKTQAQIVVYLNLFLQPQGYSLALQQKKRFVNWSEFIWAGPIALACIGVFILLQKIGIVNLLTASDVDLTTAFLLGLIASVSTCMAVVGGLVLSVSANFAKEGKRIWPQVLFHLGRLIAFFVLGGVIGVLGAFFRLSGTSIFILSLVVALVLLLLGIRLLDIFPWIERLQPTLPSFLGRYVLRLKELNHTLVPFLLGILTFFLPCGFTQSMQIYALKLGSFWSGALIMSAFALGTLPVLGLLSFSSLVIARQGRSGVFFKAVGLIVIFFAIFNLLNALVAAGIIAPFFSL